MARNFTNANTYLDAGFAPMTGTGARTVTYRVNTTASGTEYMWGWGSAGTAAQYRMRLDVGRPRLESANGFWRGTNTINGGTWQRMAVSNPASDDLSGTVIYIDGVAESSSGSSTGTALNTGSGNLIINKHSTGGAGLVGAYAEFAVWDVVLSADEMKAVTSRVSPILVRPESLVFYAPLIRDEDKDLISGLQMTLTNANVTVVAHPPVYRFAPAIRIAVRQAAAAAGGLILSHMGGIQGRSALVGGIRG